MSNGVFDWRRNVAVAALCAALHVGGVRAETWIVGKVVGVQDGDSVTVVELEEGLQRIRLGGIDAPERGQPFGYEALVHLSDLCFGRIVTARCPKVDRYGRLVCSVLVDELDVSLAQVRAGLAWHYKRFAHEQTTRERDTFAHAEDEARAEKRGLWIDESPIPPWEWRALLRSSPRRQ